MSHNNSFASKAFLVVGDVHPALFALAFLKNLLEINRIVFYQRSCLESQVFFLTNWHDESLQCCCLTITRSHLKLFWSLAMFTLLYSPWHPYKLCREKNCFFNWRSCPESQVFFKKIWPIDMRSLCSVVVTQYLGRVWAF